MKMRKSQSTKKDFSSANKVLTSNNSNILSTRENSFKLFTNSSNLTIKNDLSNIFREYSIIKSPSPKNELSKQNSLPFILSNKTSNDSSKLYPSLQTFSVKNAYKILPKNIKISKGKKKFFSLDHKLNGKCYVDTEQKLKKKLNFFRDESIRDKIIKIKEFGDFWSVVTCYVNPIFIVKKFQYLRKLNDFKSTLATKKVSKKKDDSLLYNEDVYSLKLNRCKSLGGKRMIKKPFLYTAISKKNDDCK